MQPPAGNFQGEERILRYASVCSGIEAATVAWEPLGWKAAWFSEIEKFPCAVLKHHFPDVPNLGDMTKITEADCERYGPIDLLVGGTPCQSFSVAGKRAGLDDPRGNLALDFLRLAHASRARWVVWENVPGVLSSNGGRDFGAFLGALAKLGYGWAYRILDAQYFGLAQRRRRVFVVGYLGDWRPPVAVLIERESLPGNPPTSRETGAKVAALSASGVGTCGADDNQAQAGHLVASTLRSRDLAKGVDSDCTDTLIAHTLRGEGFDASEDGTGRGTPLVAFSCKDHRDSKPNAGGQVAIVIPLDMRQASRGGTMTNNRQPGSSGGAPGTGIGKPGDPSPTLADTHTPAVACSYQGGVVVRRLTPRECERLMGFPTCIERVTMQICLDRQKSVVHVDLRCRRSLNNALPVEDGEKTAFVLSADSTLWNDRESRESLVAVHVRMSYAPKVVAIRSRGKWLWCANGVDTQRWSLQHMPPDVFALAIVSAVRSLGPSTLRGKAESLPNTRRFTLPVNGKWFAVMSGQGTMGSATAVEKKLTEDMKSIMLERGRNIRDTDWFEKIWSSFVLNATSLCIPKTTSIRNSYTVVLDLESDFTNIPYGRPRFPDQICPDGPRYRALGNSMAVPVVRWIGKRIDLVESAVEKTLDTHAPNL